MENEDALSKYKKDFHIGRSRRNKISTKHRDAFKQAADIRKFEIELYWKRSGYFWTLIAATFAGYMTLSLGESANEYKKLIFTLVLAVVGLLLTAAWYFAGRASKFWQENWESHLDLLEDDITGPLYKTILSRDKIQNSLVGPLQISVSKINSMVGLGMLGTWLFLLSVSIGELLRFLHISVPTTCFYFGLLLGILIIFYIAKRVLFPILGTSMDSYPSIVNKRSVNISKYNHLP